METIDTELGKAIKFKSIDGDEESRLDDSARSGRASRNGVSPKE